MNHTGFGKRVLRDWQFIVLALPALLYFLIFHYLPMVGVVIAFQDFKPGAGLFASKFVGFQWFREFFSSVFIGRIVGNTLLLSVYMLLWSFPIPILFALMLNEVSDGVFKRFVQSVSLLPHFISLVVMVGILSNFLSQTDGIINRFLNILGYESIAFMSEPGWFRSIYIISGIWQEFGWSSVVYIAAVSSISQQLYEAAEIDGCSRFKQMVHVTLPGIMPTMITLLILNLGNIMNVGFEKIILMYGPSTYSTADVISTFVYRRGILDAQYSYAAAVGLFNSVVNLGLLVFVNWISRRKTGVGLF